MCGPIELFVLLKLFFNLFVGFFPDLIILIFLAGFKTAHSGQKRRSWGRRLEGWMGQKYTPGWD